ncbi:MAG: glutaredoxin family protein [Candidatus Helarchaeota archaeon]
MKIIIYTKHDCERCKALKTYLDENNIPHLEKDINSEEAIQELLSSEYIVNTPIVKVEEKWMHHEFFDEGGFNKERAEGILKLGQK